MNEKTKKRAKVMLPAIRELITKTALASEKPREALTDELIIEISDKYPHEVPPKRETVLKKISAARQSFQEDPLEKHWHLGTLDDHPIPAEVIPIIFQLQKYRDTKTSRTWFIGANSLTIRDAIWISRLYVWFKDDIKALNTAVTIYSNQDALSKYNGKHFNSYEIDQSLSGRNEHIKKLSEQNARYNKRIENLPFEKRPPFSRPVLATKEESRAVMEGILLFEPERFKEYPDVDPSFRTFWDTAIMPIWKDFQDKQKELYKDYPKIEPMHSRFREFSNKRYEIYKVYEAKVKPLYEEFKSTRSKKEGETK